MNEPNPSGSYYASQTQECEEILLSPVGNVPAWISGTFIRNGPALFEAGETKLKHWFDGYGLLHSFEVTNGTIRYKSKFVESPEYLDSKKNKKNDYLTWGTGVDPCESMFLRFKVLFNPPSNTPVNVVAIHDQYYAVSDIASANRFDRSTLETTGTVLGSGEVMAAHPGFSRDGTVWNMVSKFGPFVTNTFVRLDKDFRRILYGSFKIRKSYYFHSFGNTDNYLVSIEQPMYLSFWKLITSFFTGKSFYECFDWDAGSANTLHVLNKKTGEIAHIATVDSFFYFHTINSFEKDDVLHVDLCGYADNKIVDDFYMKNLRHKGILKSNRARLFRLAINLREKIANLERTDLSIELPNTNFSFSGKEYRFAYGVHASPDSPYLADSLIKIDMKTVESTLWQEKNTLTSEPFFIEEKSSSEDAGVLISICFEIESNRSFILIVDAKTMKEVSRAYTPHIIPSSLHGAFYHHSSDREERG